MSSNFVEVTKAEADMIAALVDSGDVSTFEQAEAALSAGRRFDDLAGLSPSASPPKLYNMGGLNPVTPQYWAGLDALTLNYQVEWLLWKGQRVTDEERRQIEGYGVPLHDMTPERFDLGLMLAEYHERAQEAGEPQELPDGLGKIHPGGGKIGGVKYCKYKIERADCVLLIADAPKHSGDWPNVKIEISGERCLVYPGGAVEAYKAARGLLESFGCAIHKESVSRADFCADFPGFDMATFHHTYLRHRWACRANRHHPDQSNGVSLYFGSGAIVLRIYDKLAEMQASALRGAPAKYQHMIEKRWNGAEPEKAVRVEFQCRRDWLKSYGVTDFDSLMWYARDLLGYLTGVEGTARWFRFLTRRPHDKHSELNQTMPEWEFIQRVFMEGFSKPEPLVQIDPDKANIETLLKQALGVLETAAAHRGYCIPWKDTAAPVKYTFENYEGFGRWCALMLRATAAQSGRWQMPGFPEYDAIDRELEIMAEKKTNKEKTQ